MTVFASEVPFPCSLKYSSTSSLGVAPVALLPVALLPVALLPVAIMAYQWRYPVVITSGVLLALSVTNPSVVVGNNSSSTGTLLVSLAKFCWDVSVTFNPSDKVTFCCA